MAPWGHIIVLKKEKEKMSYDCQHIDNKLCSLTPIGLLWEYKPEDYSVISSIFRLLIIIVRNDRTSVKNTTNFPMSCRNLERFTRKHTWAPKVCVSWSVRMKISKSEGAHGIVWEYIFWSVVAASSTFVMLTKLALHKGQVEIFLLEAYINDH